MTMVILIIIIMMAIMTVMVIITIIFIYNNNNSYSNTEHTFKNTCYTIMPKHAHNLQLNSIDKISNF